ncbi:uncharacterized protein JCM6883_005380 [Sporobolomyces salmoneus]|uniref:uncharacterized protein n=1 Tax=Sporobolomyces salmoneus TaxID=183962 RepID=UPI00317AFB9B
MGVFNKLFRPPRSNSDSDLNNRSSATNNRQLNDSTSHSIQPIQPLWALATDPELSSHSRYSHHTYSGSGGRRQFGPREPRPHPSTLNGHHTRYDDLLSDRIQQMGLHDSAPPRSNGERPPPAPPHSTRPVPSPSSSSRQPHSYSYSQRPAPPPTSSTNPFPSYPVYREPTHSQSHAPRFDKPLPSTSHSPDRPRPRPPPPPIPPLPTTGPSSTTPFASPTRSNPSPRHQTQTRTNPPTPSSASPRRKNPPPPPPTPPVVIEISSSSSSSSTAEFTDDQEEEDSSIEFETTPNSSPSLRARRTPSPTKPTRSKSPPKARTPSPSKTTTTRKTRQTPSSTTKSGSKSNLSTPTARSKGSPSKRLTPSPSPSPSPSKPRSRAVSATPTTPKVQCHGLTSAGKQCTRFTTPLQHHSSRRGVEEAGEEEDREEEEEETEEEPVYCHQHTKTSLIQTGCFVKSNVEPLEVGEGRERKKRPRQREIWVNYNDWILPDLPLQTQSLLRYYLSKPVSSKDREGYIYIHELIEKAHPPTSTSLSTDLTYLKLGRTQNPILRLSQWRSSCPSLDPIVRDILPRRPPSPSPSQLHGIRARATGGGGGMMRGFAEKGTRNHFRWERLCLVEIAGRIEVLYNDPGSDDSNGSPSKAKEREKCRDCGKIHLECFRVGRDAFSSSDGGAEEGGWVREIVERWERWCRDVLG